MKRIFIVLCLIIGLFAGCARSHRAAQVLDDTLYSPRYATGLEMWGDTLGGSSLIVTRSPWQGSDSTLTTRLLILRGDDEAPEGFDGQVLRGDARRVVCMSSSHVAMLDAIGAVDRVVGVSGREFISNPYIVRNAARIADVGYDGNVDYEALIAAKPDIVLLYGVAGASVMEPKLKQLGIPYMYVGEYLESSPLGKSEWMVALSEVVGMREHGIEVFDSIPLRYNTLKMLAAAEQYRPRVMINTPYRDQWMMATDDSYLATLIDDAAGEYVLPGHKGDASFPIDIEQAYLLASGADCWINTGQVDALDELVAMLPKFANVPAVTGQNVWNTTLRATKARGNDYWESGVVRPDLVLRDLIMIFHPGLILGEPFTYYKQLK